MKHHYVQPIIGSYTGPYTVIMLNTCTTRENATTQYENMKLHSFVVSQTSTKANWVDFHFTDCLVYMALHHAFGQATGSSEWAASSRWRPCFFAADRPTYGKVLSHHHSLTYPSAILSHLTSGGFTVSITGRCWHNIAVDEAPEMFVNKNKQAIVRLQEYLTWMATFFPYRSQALHNLQEQLFPECQVHPHTAMLVLSRPEVKKVLQHYWAMRSKIEQISLFTDGIHCFHMFMNKNASPEQQNDLLRFREVEQKDFEVYV